MIGPTMMPMPQIDIALGWSLGALMSSITVWLKGLRNAAVMPWRMRKATISSSVCAAPHMAEAMTKPTVAIRNRLREPIRSESQPVIGIAMAEATI